LPLLSETSPASADCLLVDTEKLQHADIGPFALEAWAKTAVSYGWLVYVDQKVLNLRLDQLLTPLSGQRIYELEYHWATPITIDGRMRALVHHSGSGDGLWLFERKDGTLERWRVSRDDLRVSYYALSFSKLPAVPALTSNFMTFELMDAGGQREQISSIQVASDGEVKMQHSFPDVHVLNAKPRPDAHACLPMDVSGAYAPHFALLAPNSHPVLQVAFEGAQNAFMHFSFSAGSVVLWDDVGRLIHLSMEQPDILFSNVKLIDADPLKYQV